MISFVNLTDNLVVTMSKEWEALPKRNKKKKRYDGDNIEKEIVETAKVGFEERLAMITSAVSERSEANKTNSLASLTSTDGCAGENYEYLDHTADVQCHAWGSTLQEAFEAMVFHFHLLCIS